METIYSVIQEREDQEDVLCSYTEYPNQKDLVDTLARYLRPGFETDTNFEMNMFYLSKEGNMSLSDRSLYIMETDLFDNRAEREQEIIHKQTPYVIIYDAGPFDEGNILCEFEDDATVQTIAISLYASNLGPRKWSSGIIADGFATYEEALNAALALEIKGFDSPIQLPGGRYITKIKL